MTAQQESPIDQMLAAEQTPTGEIIIARGPGWVIDMSQMLFNWRIHVALTEHYGATYEKGYCYYGTGPLSAVAAFSAGLTWAQRGQPLTEHPPGYSKQAF